MLLWFIAALGCRARLQCLSKHWRRFKLVTGRPAENSPYRPPKPSSIKMAATQALMAEEGKSGQAVLEKVSHSQSKHHLTREKGDSEKLQVNVVPCIFCLSSYVHVSVDSQEGFATSQTTMQKMKENFAGRKNALDVSHRKCISNRADLNIILFLVWNFYWTLIWNPFPLCGSSAILLISVSFFLFMSLWSQLLGWDHRPVTDIMPRNLVAKDEKGTTWSPIFRIFRFSNRSWFTPMDHKAFLWLY